jgi:hypothetical protein
MADERGEGQEQGRRQGNHLRVTSDPTELTLATIFREVESLKELAFTRIDSIEQAIRLFNENLTRVPTALDKESARLKESFTDQLEAVRDEIKLGREVVETRFEGADKALELLQRIADLFPARIDEKILALQQIHEGMFRSIQKQFEERDTRVDQTAKDTKLAVDAALQAAEKAVQKSELVTSKQIDAQGDLIKTTTNGMRETMDDLKQRVVRIESLGVGQAMAKTETAQSSSMAGTIIGIVVALAGVIIAAVALMMRTR